MVFVEEDRAIAAACGGRQRKMPRKSRKNYTILPKAGTPILFECWDGSKELVVKRVGRAYFAKIRGSVEHARWGNAKEIREDINHFVESCALPRGKRMW